MIGPPGYPSPSTLRRLVVGLPGRVVARAAEPLVSLGLWNEEEVRMPARDDERDGRVLDWRVLEDHRVDVPLDVVDSHEGLAVGVRERLGVADADEERADEARARM